MGNTTDLVKAHGADNPDYLVEQSDFASVTPTGQKISSAMTTLVKGAGYTNTAKPTAFGSKGNAPLEDDDQIFSRAMRAEKSYKSAIKQGINDPTSVFKSLSPEFSSQFGAFMAANPQNQMMSQLVGNLQQQLSTALGKSFELNTPLASGLVPFNLVAP